MCFFAPIDYRIKLVLVDDNSCENSSYFTLKWFLLNSGLFGGELQKDENNNPNLEIFENA